MCVNGGFGAHHQFRSQALLLHPALFALGGGLRGRQVRNAQGRHIPGAALQEEPDALFVHDVPVFDGVGAVREGCLHRIRVGGVGHHVVAALAAQSESGGKLLLQQEGVDVLVPERAHNAAGEVQLDVVHAVLDLLPHRVDETVGAVALAGVA